MPENQTNMTIRVSESKMGVNESIEITINYNFIMTLSHNFHPKKNNRHLNKSECHSQKE